MSPEELSRLWGEYDCIEAFCYLTGTKMAGGPIGWDDVVEVVAQVQGENDGPNWVAAGYLNDGRAFLLVAGCDYTGWDCRADGWSNIGPTLDAVVHPWVCPDEVRRDIADQLRAYGVPMMDTADCGPLEVECRNTAWDGTRPIPEGY